MRAQQEQRKRNKLPVILVVIALVLVPAAIAFGPDLLHHWKNEKLLDEGVPASATILGLEDTGNRYNDNPEVVLTLEVKKQSGETYVAETRKILSAVDLMKYQPGTTVTVMIDPEDPSRVAVIESP